MPLVPRDPVVAIAVEICEPIVAVVILVVRIEEFRLRDDAVTVVVGAPEPLAIEMPFVPRDAAVAVMVERGEAAWRPVVEFVFSVG